MLKRNSKYLCLVIALFMLAGLLGCVSKTEEKTLDSGKAGQSEQSGTRPENPYEQKFEISWVSWNCGDIEQDNWAAKKLEEKLNIKLTTRKVDLSQTQQLDLMLASGEMPDCGWIIGKSPAQMDSQGLIRSIPKSMITKYAPSYTKLLDSEPLGWKLNLVPGKSDEYLALTGYQAGRQDSINFISVFRLDWLENVGISPNGPLEQIDRNGRIFLCQEPFNKEQFANILKSFTKKDPDKNGADDTFGMTAGGRNVFFWNSIYGMFGFQDSGTINENGHAVEYYVSNGYKEFLKYANNLYKQGAIDREFPTLDHTKAWEKYSANKCGYGGTSVLWLNETAAFTSRPPLNMLKNAGAKVLITPPMVGDNGKGGTRPYSYSNYQYYFYVAKNVKDDKLARILQLFDYANFDEKAKLYLRYGEEGTHFEWSGKPGESAPKLKEGVKNGSIYGLYVYNSNYIAELDITKLSWEENTAKVQKYAWNEWQKYLIKPYKLDIANQTKLSEYKIEFGATINTLVDEYFYRAIVGEVDVDASWDKYIKSLNDAGYTKIQEELDKAPLYEDILKGNF